MFEKMSALYVQLLVLLITISDGLSQDVMTTSGDLLTNFHNGFTEKIGNFSLELLYHAAKEQNENSNMIMSPITVWTVMSLIAEGASENTLAQMNYALRLTNNKTVTRMGFQNVARWLQVHTNTVELQKLNAIFVDENKLPLRDFQTIAKNYYDTSVITLNFEQKSDSLADLVNQGVSKITHGKIPQLVDSSAFSEAEMILVSALYFKGQWTSPFNASSTTKRPFYDSNGVRIGEVNMMYNRHTYPFANIKELQARVIELPYGVENRLSMLIMLPYTNVTLEDMFLNFLQVPLDTVFAELRISQDEYGEDEVDCLIPRFMIESNMILTDTMKKFGIVDLFDKSAARLPHLARTPLYVSKIIHKAKIEVTEEGTTAAGATAAEFANRIGIARFEGNRPFSYVIVEKVTNSIVFGGFYKQPSLY